MKFCLEEKSSKKQKFNMLAIIFIIGVSIIQCVQPRLLPEKCREYEGTCDRMPSLFNFTVHNKPITYEAAIELHCPYEKLDLYARCLEIWKLRCISPKSLKMISTYLQAPPILDMCSVRSPYRKDFIEYAVCLRNIHNRYVKCDDQHKKAVDYHRSLFKEQIIKQAERKSLDIKHLKTCNREEAQEIMCGLFQQRVQCVSDVVREFCGPSIESFSRQYEVLRFQPTVKACYEPAPEEVEMIVEVSEDPLSNNYQYDFEIDDVSTGSNNEKNIVSKNS